jgi:hypothetical protein
MGLISVRARDALGFFKPNRPVSVMSVDSKLNFAKRTAPTFQPTKSGGMGRTGDSLMLRGGSNPGQAWRTSGYGTVFKVTGDDAVVRAAVSSALTGQANTQAAFEAHGGNARMTVLVGVGGLTIAECAEPAAVLRAEQWNQSQLAPRRSVMNGQALILDQFPSARTAIAPTTAVLQSGSITKRAYTSRQGLATTENGLGQSFDTEATAVTVPVPIFNQYDAILMQAHLVRGRLVSPPSPNAAGSATPKTVGIVGPNEGVMRVDGGDGTLPTGYPGALHSQDGNPAPFNEFTQASFSAPWRSALDLANHARTQLGTNDANFNAVSGMFTEMPQNVQKVDFATPLPPASDHREGAAGEAGNPIVEWGGLAADLGLSFVPGYDVKDAVIYGFWKPIFGTTEEQNNVWLNAMTATFSVLGLAADAGYFAGPAGFATNAMPALLKTFTKWCAKKLGLAENIFERMLKFGADAREAVQHKLDWIGRSWKQSEAGLITGSITQVADKLIDWSTTTARNAIETFLRPDRRWHSFWGVDPNAGIDRVRKGMNAYQNLLHREFKVLAPDAAKLQGTARAMDRARAWMRGSGVVMNETDVQLAMRAVRGQPARVAGMSDEAYNALLKNGDEAMVETSETFNRVFNQAEALPVGPGRERLENTVRDALENARQVPTSHLRGLVDAHVGPDKAFKTMQQFEAMRVLPFEHLSDTQKVAMRAIRESIGHIAVGTQIAKVLSEDAAIAMLRSGNPNIAGFFCRKADIDDLTETSQLSRRLGLGYDGSPFTDGGMHAVLEGPANAAVVARSGIPVRQGSMGTPPSAGYVDVPSSQANLPFTSNGLSASLDGRRVAEMRMSQPTEMTPDLSTIRLKRPITIEAGTSDRWILRLDASSPTNHRWEPLPP